MKVTVHPISEIRTIRFNVEGPALERPCTPEMVEQYLADDMQAYHDVVHDLVRSTYPDVDLIEESLEVLHVRTDFATEEELAEHKARFWFSGAVEMKVQVYSIGGEQ